MQRRDAIRAIKERLNLADIARRYVALKRNGPRWMAPCPFHQETKPSFSINEETGLFYCFGCQASGDMFDFYGRINGLDFRECLEQLAAEAGVDLDMRREGGAPGGAARQQQRSERQQMLRMYELAAMHYARNLAGAQGAVCRAYVERRGIDTALAERFGLGYALPGWQDLAAALRRGGCDEALAVKAGLLGKHDKGGYSRSYDRFRGRLIFPIRNLSNHVIAFGGRIIGNEDEAKYINSADSLIYKKGDQLYALPQARRHIAIKGNALLTEGYLDVLTLHQFGYEHAVGALGTSLTPEQVKRLSGFTSRITLLFDGDAAGRKAAQRTCELLLPRGLACRVVLLPQGQDIDDLLRKQGPEEFEKLLETAPDGLRFCLDTVKRMAPRDAVAWARDFLKDLVTLPELYSQFASNLAHALNLREAELKGEVLARQKDAVASERGTASPRESNLDFERQILRFMARYPHRCRDLQEAGADVFLRTSRARDVWKKFLEHPADEMPYHLDEREKAFWMRCRTGEAPPLDNEEGELAPLLQKIAARHTKMARSSVAAALREAAGTGDFESDIEYIIALRETQRTDDE